jgi:hypothetical protein
MFLTTTLKDVKERRPICLKGKDNLEARDFVYWLHGFFELRDDDKSGLSAKTGLSVKQTDMIRKHLELVFKNVTSPAERGKVELSPEAVIDALSEAPPPRPAGGFSLRGRIC